MIVFLCIFQIAERQMLSFLLLVKVQVQIQPSEKPISEFFMKRSATHGQSLKPNKTSPEVTQAFRIAKEECDELGENELDKTDKQQPAEECSSAVKDEPAALEPQTFYT